MTGYAGPGQAWVICKKKKPLPLRQQRSCCHGPSGRMWRDNKPDSTHLSTNASIRGVETEHTHPHCHCHCHRGVPVPASHSYDQSHNVKRATRKSTRDEWNPSAPPGSGCGMGGGMRANSGSYSGCNPARIYDGVNVFVRSAADAGDKESSGNSTSRTWYP